MFGIIFRDLCGGGGGIKFNVFREGVDIFFFFSLDVRIGCFRDGNLGDRVFFGR